MKQYIKNNQLAQAGHGWAEIEFKIPIYEELTEDQMMEGVEPKIVGYNTISKRVLNPTEQMLIDSGYVKYVEPEYIKTLDDYKREKIAELVKYDKSEAVNEFYYGDIADWVPLETRNNIRNNSIPSQENEKRTEMYVSLGKVAGVFPIITLKAMLQKLEDYAYQCWVVTDRHKRAIQALMTAEEIEAYDFTAGYPEKIRFEVL